MKTTLSFLFCCFLFTAGFSQTTETFTVKSKDINDFISNKVYKYKTFIPAKVVFKKGEEGSGRMNYNYILGGMQFIGANKDTLLLDNLDNLQYIAILTDTFFYIDDAFYEWMATSPKGRLLSRTTLTVLGSAPIGAYGVANETTKVQSIDEIHTNTTLGLDINEEQKIKRKKTYYIYKNKNDLEVATKSNFSSLFPKVDVDEYVKVNKLNLKKEEDVVDLFYYVNGN